MGARPQVSAGGTCSTPSPCVCSWLFRSGDWALGLRIPPAERACSSFQPLLVSWASLAAQLVKNPPAMWETWVRSLGWEDPLEKGIQYSGLENSMDCIVHGVTKSQTQLSDFHFTSLQGTDSPPCFPLVRCRYLFGFCTRKV